jgi:hypothetical protein
MKNISKEDFYEIKCIERKKKEKSKARKAIEFLDTGEAVMFDKKDVRNVQSVRSLCHNVKKSNNKKFIIKETKKGQVLVLRTV